MKQLPAYVPWYYAVLIHLAIPVYRLLIYKKSKHYPDDYQRELNERFGRAYLPVPMGNKGVIWCHAVSLGELNTAYPLLKLLLNQGFSLWITSTTKTGFARVPVLFANELGSSVNHSFVPIDSAGVIGRFLEHVRPILTLFIETELWATTLYELKKRHIPSVMVNARLTNKSFLGYQKFKKISQGMMANLTRIIAQDAQSAKYFHELGASSDKILVANSLKWASTPSLSQANQALLKTIQQSSDWALNRPIWVAGSTHAGEEQAVLLCHEKLLKHMPNALLILVPRHPERFDDVAQLCQRFTVSRRSRQENIAHDTQIYLADSMGELLVWYALADVVFVGGSLVDVGGHNPIEPASLAKGVIMGRYVKNCTVLVETLKQAQALLQVACADELSERVQDLFDDLSYAKILGENGKQLVLQNQNAAIIQMQMVLDVLKDTKNHNV